MPTDPSPTEPAESTATDRRPADRGHEVAGWTGSDRGDTSEPAPAGGRDAADPGDDRVAALERRVAELEGELEAVRGLLDGVGAVDETVERRASAALAKAEALEERFAPEETGLVRERLPDGDEGREAGDDRAGQRRGDCRDLDPAAAGSGRTASRGLGGDGRARAGSTDGGETEHPTSAGAVGGGRKPPAGADATDDGSAETGAIGSVGPDRADGDAAAEGSLAARLRAAFR